MLVCLFSVNSNMVAPFPYQDEQFAWQLIETLGQGVTIVDREGLFIYVNSAYAKMVGRSQAALIGVSPLVLTHPEDHPTLQAAGQQRLNGLTSTYETRLLHANGSIIHVHITGVPRWQDNQVIGSFTIVTDITAHKRVAETSQENAILYQTLFSEIQQLHETTRQQAIVLEKRVIQRTAELEEERGRLQAILDTAGEAIYFSDANKIVRYVNPATERITGYTAEEIVGHPGHLWRGTTSQAVINHLEATVDRGEIWQGEVINRRKDGSLYDAYVTLSPLKNSQQQIIGHIGIQRDITALKELTRLREQFVSHIGHELRTPLTNLQMYLNLLRQGKPEKREHYMQVMQQAINRLGKLIDAFLEISNLTTDTEPVKLVPVALNALLYKLWQEKKTTASERQQTILFQLQPAPVFVWADSFLLSQLISHLLENALDYTPKGGEIIISLAQAEWAGEMWQLVQIQDNGPGIAEHEIPHLFDRFYRGGAAADYTISGTGLGLAICREIGQKLGGRITVESIPHTKTTFSVWLKPASKTS